MNTVVKCNVCGVEAMQGEHGKCPCCGWEYSSVLVMSGKDQVSELCTNVFKYSHALFIGLWNDIRADYKKDIIERSKEIDRLRAELERTKALLPANAWAYKEENDILRAELGTVEGALLQFKDEAATLRAELAKAQEETVEIHLDMSAIIAGLENRAEAAEARANGLEEELDLQKRGWEARSDKQRSRIKELELSLSEQYVKGMEEAARIADNTPIHAGRAADSVNEVISEIRKRITEIKRAAENKEDNDERDMPRIQP